jgi:hypothetical protein
MRIRISPALFALLLAAGPAFAQFEGVLEMKMTMAAEGIEGGGGGTMKVEVGKAGTRSTVDMQMGPMSMKMVMLHKNDTPDTIYRINDANKSYAEIDLAKMRQTVGQRQKATEYTVEKLGEETMLGYKTLHVVAKEKKAAEGEGMNTEMWVAKDVLDYATYSKLQARPGKTGGDEGLVKALKEAGTDGMPLKAITSMPGGAKTTMEVVKVEKRSLPASTFEIPAGYTKSGGGMMDMLGGMGGAQADEASKKMGDAQKRMDDAMKNLTPEQREMIQKMMKQQKGGGQQHRRRIGTA